MISIDCPVCGDGEIIFRAVANGDGDPDVVGGTRTWTEAEFVERTCTCELTEEQDATAQDEADERAFHEDYGDDY